VHFRVQGVHVCMRASVHMCMCAFSHVFSLSFLCARLRPSTRALSIGS
jgi:predicted metal-binding protein